MNVYFDKDGFPTLALRQKCLARFEEECEDGYIMTDDDEWITFVRKIDLENRAIRLALDKTPHID